MTSPTEHRLVAWVLLACLCLSGCGGATSTADHTSLTIDVGLVVSDIDKSADFYTAALGFKELGQFDFAAQPAGDVGLTDYKGFQARVFALGSGATATKLKLIQMESPKQETKFIDGASGIRFLTLFVSDLNAALTRAAAAGVKPLGKGPIYIPGNNPGAWHLALVQDPDGNLIELVGPKK